MSRRAPFACLPLVAVAAGTLTWLGAAELETPARAFTVVLIGLLPPLLLVQAAAAPEEFEHLPVAPVYVSSMAFIWMLGIAALWAGTASGFTHEQLGLRTLPVASLLAWTGGLTLAALSIAVLGRALRWTESPLLEWLLPKSPRERAVFALVSLSAGIGEEMAFRGFLIPALRVASGSMFIAVAVSSLAFGMMHSYQRIGGALRASALGALLATPMIVTGSVIPSMAAHAAFDLLVGLVLANWLLGRDTEKRSRGREH